eukprot:TRINITY_DN11607_c0_g1_i1.p1 TRINITY_DN11607_c0_g1~~TRINITY_DN11607_c0_g1_i1.p1  ORF type:complete len:379 (-),score=98.18 TRINITY_DN11607_c0_g1_i1:58-1194(-)
MVSIASKAHQDLVNRANATSDIDERQRILKAAEDLKAASMAVIQAAKLCAQNPSEENKRKLKQAYDLLEKAINRARGNEATPAGFEPLPVFAEDDVLVKAWDIGDIDFVANPNDSALLAAAKEQARAALEILRESELAAGHDAVLRRRIDEAGQGVRLWSKNIVEAAKKADANPNDAKAQAEFANAQGELGKAINKLVALSRGGVDVSEALNLLNISTKDAAKGEEDGLSSQIKAFLEAADRALADIQKYFGPSVKLSAQQLVENARNIALTGRELSKLLQNLGTAVKDDAFKHQLVTCSQILNDKGLQLKILAAVKASEGGDQGGQVKSGAQGLGQQIKQVKDTVRSLALRFRLRNTQKQTQILKQIAALVRKGRTY